MPGIGLQGTYGLAGAQDALQQLLSRRMEQEKIKRDMAQQEFENQQAQQQSGRENRGLDLEELRLTQPQPKAPMAVGPGYSVVDPTTGRIMTTAPGMPDKPQGPVTLSAGARLVDPTSGREIANAPAQGPQPSYEWVTRDGKPIQIREGTARPGDSPYEKGAAAKDNAGSMASLYSAVRGSRAIESIDELLKDTNWATTGPLGVIQGKIMPGTPGYDYASKLEALGSQIAQQELAQMREASKTGGAVGQVSNFEQQMFMNALAPIQQGQSKAAMLEGLKRAKASLGRYRQAILLKAQGMDDEQIMRDLYGAAGAPFAMPQGGGGGNTDHPPLQKFGATYTWDGSKYVRQ